MFVSGFVEHDLAKYFTLKLAKKFYNLHTETNQIPFGCAKIN